MTDQIARIHALLDAHLALGEGALFLHESTCPRLAEAVIEWTRARKLKIDTTINTNHGRTYESWDILLDGPGSAIVHAFPKEMGLLDDINDLKSKIEKIRKEADDTIRQLVAAEQAKAAQS